MNRIFGILLGLFVITSVTHADVVDPIGSDKYKTITVKIRQLDQRTTPNQNVKTWVTFSLGDKEIKIDTAEVSQDHDVEKQITIPAAQDGTYYVGWGVSGDNYHTVESGKLAEGTKTIEVRLKRIDVNPMVVTRPNGSTYLATTGTVEIQIYDEDHSMWRNRMTYFDMGYGVDVGAGFYKVTVSATSEDGIDVFNQKLDFRNL
jgi:hypothetical protein